MVTRQYYHHKSYRDSSQADSTFFAESCASRKVANIRRIKSPKAERYSSFHYPFSTYRKHFSETRRFAKNLVKIGSLTLDVDWDGPEPLDWRELLRECGAHCLPYPNYIIRTATEGHYQMVWQFPYLKRDRLGFYYRVAEALCEVFRDYYIDRPTTLDVTRLTRNPLYERAEVVFCSLHQVTLGELYKALKDESYIKPKPKRRRNQTPFSYSLSKLRSFFTSHPHYTGTHESIYKRLNMPRSTYFRLLNDLRKGHELEIETLRTGKTWQTEFTYFDSLRRDSLTYFRRGGEAIYLKRLEKFVANGVPRGFRNKFLFILSRFLNFHGVDADRILVRLRLGLEKCKAQGDFNDAEIRRTIKSACRERYRHLFSREKLGAWGFLDYLDSETLRMH